MTFRIDKEKIAKLENKCKLLNNKIEELYKKKEDTSTLVFEVEKIDENIKAERRKGIKVWDHCHITGKFRGAAHSDCNLQLQIKPWKMPIPVIIHNFRGYDSHIVCQSVAKSASAHQVRVIAETFERYKTMKVGQLKYMDSYQFMNSSLSSLADNLGAIKCKKTICSHFHEIDKERCFGTLENHKITVKHYKNYTQEQIAMLCRKGIYPYEYIDSFERFLETELPPIEKFNSKLAHLKDNPELQFEWLETIQKTKSDASRGYFVNIKAHFPIGTHDKLKDLPPAVENIAVKLLGLFKDECPNNAISKSYHIRSKLYHYVLADKTTKSKHKGVSKNGMNEMAQNSYPNNTAPMSQVYHSCIFDNKVYYAKNIGIRSKDHILSVVESEKKAVAPVNDKFWIFKDGVSYLPYFHWRIDAMKKFVANGMSEEEAEKRAMKLTLKPEYQ
ncbi:19684_t:CDS:2 [Entrophospora sp. SA101]|nr:19684_t:CDS:2 [Entrophospora sp. SA101]